MTSSSFDDQLLHSILSGSVADDKGRTRVGGMPKAGEIGGGGGGGGSAPAAAAEGEERRHAVGEGEADGEDGENPLSKCDKFSCCSTVLHFFDVV